jgi:hypothetical protein
MNNNKFSSILRTGTVIVALLMTFASMLQSCDDDETSAPASFSIEGNPTGLTSGIAGKTQSYVVRAIGSWKIVAKEGGDWVKAFPTEGDDDGIFKITVAANAGLDTRVASFAFVVNGQEQPGLFRVEQDANTPTMTLPSDMTIPNTGGNVDVSVTTNTGNWKYTLSDASWLTEISKSATGITLNAPVNNGPARSAVLTVTSVDYPTVSKTVTIQQEAIVPVITLPEKAAISFTGGNIDVPVSSNVAWSYTLSDPGWLTEVSKSSTKITLTAVANNAAQRSVVLTVTAVGFPDYTRTVTLTQGGFLVFEENFDWLAYGSAVPYTTAGETIITNWTTEQQAKGWTSSLNPFSNDKPLYARQGFVKLGKTNYGGDIISPKLSAISGTKNIKVTFKAAVYVSATGVIDSGDLVIEVLGAGTSSTGLIVVNNVPNSQTQDSNGVVNNIWADDRAFTFNITGATADTQIRFIGKAFDLTTATPNRNRIFLDDIKVEIAD